MSKKGFPVLTIAPLQHVIAEPITDPAEQSALERHRQHRKQSEQKKLHRRGAKSAVTSAAKKRV
ncbi:MAG: hypothetical protein L0215_03700 [Gemmataceae bacterium]|nr:hypothetical protein [Gemmataceae bacterium]